MNTNKRPTPEPRQECAPPEPIAIIGLGCRFPGGADDPQSYWQLLDEGRDAITQTPADRWNLQKFYCAEQIKPSKTQSQWGGYVEDIDQFDPQLFGISPREAVDMDPQQRMLLEVTWRAFEDAGLPVEQVAGRAVSVFAGISSFDYAVGGLSYQDRGVIGPYCNTGGSSSIAANRISYCFDLRGPSVAVDTACSSSLVAIHMACESILRGDAEMALAGGVNALLLPDFYVAFSQLGVLSPDGRCKTFDARANGYVRAEGAGMVLLKPLRAAIRDGDHIYSVIRATALNQDGRTQGMTVPSQNAQESLLRTVCERADIDPVEIQYIEAHGTGTPVGDPIEANALASVLCEHRDDEQPCWIGSVKTNIGHLEAGAGIASVIKVALALKHKRIPAHLHFETPNPAIEFDKLKLQIPLTSQDWICPNDARIAGINGFGYGGANAHVLMSQAPAAAPNPNVSNPDNPKPNQVDRPKPKLTLLPISARNKASLAAVAAGMADWLQRDGAEHSMADIASFAAHRRSHHECRAAISGTNVQQWISQLRDLAASPDSSFDQRLSSAQLDKGVLFVCSGQGPQWWAMGRQLYSHNQVFRDAINKCDREFAKYISWSLVEELQRSEHKSRLQQTAIAQPSIFALQIALAAVWKDRGVRPRGVVGHSVGEIAAGYLSGALTWQDACCVAVHRGRTMDLASSRGAMIAAGLSADETRQWIRGLEKDVSLAAINGPTSVTISGADEAIETLAKRLEKAGVFCRRLQVEYAFHSPQMDPVRDELLRSLANIQPRATHTTLISTVTGDYINGSDLDAEYWWKNVRQSVRFADAMTVAADAEIGIALEIGSHPVLTYAITECFQNKKQTVRVLPSLHRERDDNLCMADSLCSLYAVGMDIDWSRIYQPPSNQSKRIELPVYPFKKQRCWGQSFESTQSRLAQDYHPLLGESQYTATPTWQNRIDLNIQTYLADHCVRQACMLPAAAMIEMAAAASCQIKSTDSIVLQRVRMLGPCMLSDDRPQRIETVYRADRRSIELSCSTIGESNWQPIAVAQLSDDVVDEPFDGDSLESARVLCTETVSADRVYEYCAKLGLDYGETFRGIVRAVRRPTQNIQEGRAVVEVELHESLTDENSQHVLHPSLLDSCFHGMIVADPIFDRVVGGLYLPTEIREIRVLRKATKRVTAHIRFVSKNEYRLVADIDVFDDRGNPCVCLRGFESQRVGAKQADETTHDLIYGYQWETADPPERPEKERKQRTWCVFSDSGELGDKLASAIGQRGDDVVTVQHGVEFQQIDSQSFVIDPENRDDFDRVLRERFDDAVPSDVVYLWGLDATANADISPEMLDKSTRFTSLAPMHLVQAWESIENSTSRFTIVTTGAQSPDDSAESVTVAQCPLVGFGRVVISECARLKSKLVDLPAVVDASDIESLLAEVIATDDDEDEIMIRSGQRFVHRFGPLIDTPIASDATKQLGSQLRVGRTSGIEELQYRTKAQLPLSAGEVEIEVLASGLNFSDVMKTLGLYPGLPDGPVALGAECSGRISRVADSSAHWKVGDEVIAVAPGSFATHVTVNADLVARKPAKLTHAQAATIPIAFLTAQHALNQCARMTSDDRVLIHSASGGVGIAAMQLAKIAGATIFATAGNDEKREYVRQLGAAKVMDSRSLAFADETLQATDGEGIDIVLNSLPGEAIAKGLSILKTGGRFLEIGKRDIYSDAPLGLHPFRNNLALFAIDLDQLFKREPARMGKMLRDLVPRFESGELTPLPTTEFAADETRVAYRFMQQAKHVGKVVVHYDRPPRNVLPGDFSSIEFKQNATYWLAGGLGGFGLQVARWLVENGAGSIVLSGRSKTVSAEASEVISELQSAGATVTVLPADITKPQDVRAALSTIQSDLPPLRGVFHTAMVLEDRLLVDLDRETLQRVLRPKVLGGWNLHHETIGLPLDHFVLFSSLASVFGHAGQANYSAANAMLDGLGHYRRSQGLPACVMNWGHLGEVGYLARRSELGERLERQGVLSFTVQQATDALEYALQTQATQLSVLRMDWSRWRGLSVSTRMSPRFAHLQRNRAAVNAGDQAEATSAEDLRNADPETRSNIVGKILRSKSGTLLGIDPEVIDCDRPLLELGLDSLMAVELRNWIECQIEINLPISELMRSASLEHLTQTVCEIIDGQDPDHKALPDTINGEKAEDLLQEFSDLDDDQVSDLLAQMLRQQE